mmetsp:Transcript_952/g.2299  ORF Transcript_952/g.2299 Transcript_952/m.2299 type:complete len:212 (-) Transcript_952:3557-4192(-)
MPRDAHQVSTDCHDVAEDGKMPVIHVDTVNSQHIPELLHQPLSHCFDSKHRRHFNKVVGNGSPCVYTWLSKHSSEVAAVCFKLPFLAVGDASISLDVGFLDFLHEDFVDIRKALEPQVLKHASFKSFQVVPVVAAFFIHHETNTEDKLGCVIISVDDMHVVLVLVVDSVEDVAHRDLLVHHRDLVQLNTQQPRRHSFEVDTFIRDCEVVLY